MIKKRKNEGIVSWIMVLLLMLGLILSGVVPVVAAEISETPLVEVSFDPQGGIGTMDSLFCSPMTNITLPENGFMAPEGKTFKIWEIEGQEYAPGAEMMIGDDTVVKAVWEDGLEESIETDERPDSSVGDGITENPQANVLGIADDPNPDYGTVDASESSDPSQLEVSFDPQGGTGTMDSVFCSLMTNITLPENGFMAPEGKTFKIWENEGKEYAPGAEITIGDDTVVKAVWEDEAKYTLAFDVNRQGSYSELPEVPYLGVAGNFNFFVLKNLHTYNTDSEGRVAVGESATLTNFGVGSKLTRSNSRYDLIIGGTVNVNGGENHNGNTLIDTNSSITQFNYGHANQVSDNPFLMDVKTFFQQAEAELKSLTEKYKNFTSNGTVTNEYGALKLTGDDPENNVFTLDATELQNANGVHINVPDGSTIIINVTGNAVTFPSAQIFYNGQAATINSDVCRRILWNLPQAQTLTGNGVAIIGSVLAPYADSTLQNGQFNGTLIVENHTGSYEGHYKLFHPNFFPEDIPISSSWKPEVTKKLTGRDLVADEFEFELKEGEHVLQTVKNNADGSIPFQEITFTSPGTHIYTVTEITGTLPGVTYDTKTISYTVTIDANGNVEATVPSSTEFNNSFENEEKVTVSGTKTWNDNNNQDGKRPDEITINLLKNGTKIDSKVVKKSDGWKWKFEGLDKYENGQEITYSISEEAVEGYSTEINGYDVKNSYTPGKTSVQVTKAWKDNNNQDGKRPDAITIKLLADGEDTGKTLVLTATNNWTDTFTDLDEYKAGQKIVYTIEEVAVGNGYTSAVTGNAETGFTVTNSYTPPTEPTEPTPPTEPTEPTTPTEPTKPTTPTEPTKPTGHTQLPKTGEDSGPYLWLSLMCMSVGALLLLFRRKTNIQND